LLEFRSAHGVGYLFESIAETMCEVISGVDLPLVSGTVVMVLLDTRKRADPTFEDCLRWDLSNSASCEGKPPQPYIYHPARLGIPLGILRQVVLDVSKRTEGLGCQARHVGG
jgi:hypothetical protein